MLEVADALGGAWNVGWIIDARVKVEVEVEVEERLHQEGEGGWEGIG